MREGHVRKVCQFGIVHSQCRCPSPTKTDQRIDCTTPDTHRPSKQQQKQAATAGWIDPPNPPMCLDGCERPELRREDAGRRWQCQNCRKVWQVTRSKDERDNGAVYWKEVRRPTDYAD